MVQANAKVEWASSKKLDEVLSRQKPFSDKTRLGYTGESSSTVNISKEVKFVKAKEPVAIAPTMEKEKVEKKKRMWLTKGCWTSLATNQRSSLKPKGYHLQNHKEVQERTMYAIIVDFKDTPDLIVIS